LANGDTRQVQADIAVACDGVNSAVRKQLFPDDKVCFAGINTWRGVTVHKPILSGKSYMRIGSIDTGKMVIYPIVDNVDGQGNQLINWTSEIRLDGARMNDWNKPGNPADTLEYFKDWKFPWLDVPNLIMSSERVFEYPMVDKDALPQWSFGRVTLMGDAAHPMYPRGSNGSAQGLIDARTLADLLAQSTNHVATLKTYQDLRLPATAKVVETNRSQPPDFIIMKADELSGDKPFKNIDDLISKDELRKISDHYQEIAGCALKSGSFSHPRRPVWIADTSFRTPLWSPPVPWSVALHRASPNSNPKHRLPCQRSTSPSSAPTRCSPCVASIALAATTPPMPVKWDQTPHVNRRSSFKNPPTPSSTWPAAR
jgi:flavin-dependent dehydrogenase